MAKGLRSIGINKIIPAQIDFTQITSGSAAGDGSVVALKPDGTPTLINPLQYLNSGGGRYEPGGSAGVFTRFITADADYTNSFQKKDKILIERQAGVSDVNSGQMQVLTVEGLAYGMADGTTITALNGKLTAVGGGGSGDIEGVTAGSGLTGGGTTGTVTLNIGAGTGISVAADSISTNDSEIVHDNLSGFVSDEHIAHSTVSITAGNGLTGGGTIAATRTINVGAGTGISVAADSISTNDSEIVHDNLSGFVSDEHVAHSTVSITAGNGLTGGGTIAATRTINVGAGTGITVNADDISFDPDGATLTFLNSSVDQILINDGGVFKRIPPGYIDISSFNNDSGFTSNIGDMTGVNISVGAGLDITQNNTTSGDYSATLSLDLTEVIANSATANAILTSDGDGTLTGETNLTFDGTNLTIANQGKVIFDTADTYIAANTDNPEDLEIHTNQDIHIKPDNDILIYYGATQYGTFDGDNYRFRLFRNDASEKYPLELINKDNTDAAAIGMKFNLEDDGNNELTAASIRAKKTQTWEAGTDTTKDGQLVINTLLNNVETDVAMFSAAGSTIYQALTINGITNLNSIVIIQGNTYSYGDISMQGQTKVAFNSDTTNTYIAANTDSPEDLEIHADQDILLNADGVVECYSALRVQDYISHIGDTDTSIEFTDDKIVIDAGGVEMITITEDTQNSVVINEGGGDVDFRVESDAISYAFWVRGSDGRVGIGETIPEGKVHIKQAANGSSDNYAGDALVIENTDASHKWYIGIDSDNDLVFAYGSPNQATAGGYLQGGVDVNNIDFTGQHRSVPSSGSVNEYSDKIGMIVVSTGEYYNHSGAANTIDSALPKICLSSVAKDKSVYGVVSSITDENSDNQTYNLGTFGTMFPKSEDRVIVNALGEGSIWVTNINGNFENGDYITTSTIPGYGMKQDDDLLHNYTAAKITQDCNFDLNSTYDCEEFEYNGVTYRRAFVGCTYHCG